MQPWEFKYVVPTLVPSQVTYNPKIVHMLLDRAVLLVLMDKYTELQLVLIVYQYFMRVKIKKKKKTFGQDQNCRTCAPPTILFFFKASLDGWVINCELICIQNVYISLMGRWHQTFRRGRAFVFFFSVNRRGRALHLMPDSLMKSTYNIIEKCVKLFMCIQFPTFVYIYIYIIDFSLTYSNPPNFSCKVVVH